MVLNEERVLKAMLLVASLIFVEVVHVQLTDKGRKVIMFKILGQDNLGQLTLLLHDEVVTLRGPCDNVVVFIVLWNKILIIRCH